MTDRTSEETPDDSAAERAAAAAFDEQIAAALPRQSHMPGATTYFAEDTFALKFLLQSTERLFDVVVANIDLHVVVTTFLG